MTTMRALIYDRYGPPEQVLRLDQAPKPQPKPSEVLVQVAAAVLNSWDRDQLAGPPVGRVRGSFRPPYRILGGAI